jgi:Zn-finger nucleic acid-binding protein
MADIWGQRKKGLEKDDFHRKDRKRLEQMSQRLVPEEQERWQEATFSYCPKCREDLEEILFRGVTVDRCPGCSGVWLDAEEVERLTARASQGWLSLFWRSFGRSPQRRRQST